MGRLQDALARRRAEGMGILMAYLCAGDPTPQGSVDALVAAASGGADILEVGWPFSDPVADGPVIQRASQRALAHTGRREVLGVLSDLRRQVDQPIALLSYCNPLLRHGLESTLGELGSAGVDALVVPDLPFEESASWRAACRREGIALIPFVAPTTEGVRLEEIARHAEGFVYAVALLGVTGARMAQSEDILPVVAKLRQWTDVPVLAGFGIGDGESAALWRARGLDGVIVGSALVQALSDRGAQGLAALVGAIRAGLDQVGQAGHS